ncbi:MAG: class I SAM-dependent methyltransferase [Phycisphaerae bacterium]
MSAPPIPCPLCANLADRALSQFERDFCHCTACDLVFVPHAQHLDPAVEKARYETHENTMDNAGYVAMFERFLAIFAACAPGVRTVLDYGCGPGPVLVELLRRRGYRAEGFDPFFARDADLLRPFDAVVSTETFEHFARPDREMERLSRLVRPGGVLAVMTLFHSGRDGLADWWYMRDQTHVAFYSHATLHWISRHFGFDVVFQEPKNIIVMRRRLEPEGR